MVRPTNAGTFRSGRRNHIIDRLGRELPLLTSKDLPADAPGLVVKAVQLANLHRAWPQLRLFLIAWGGAVLVSLGVRYGTTIRVNPILWWIAMLVIAARVSSYGGRRKIHDNAMNAYTLCLAAGICPSCGYRLFGVPPRPDGNTICPECAGAWMMSRGDSSAQPLST